VLGVPDAPLEDEKEEEPWKPKRPSPLVTRLPFSVPPEVKAVLAQRLFVEKGGLPTPLPSRLRRLAAFQNPEFYKRQKLRLSTARTPRFIVCAEDSPSRLCLQRPARSRNLSGSCPRDRRSGHLGPCVRRAGPIPRPPVASQTFARTKTTSLFCRTRIVPERIHVQARASVPLTPSRLPAGDPRRANSFAGRAPLKTADAPVGPMRSNALPPDKPIYSLDI